MKIIYKFLFLLMISDNVFAAPKTITCGFNACSVSTGVTPDFYMEKANESYIDLGSSNLDDVIVTLPNNQDPRNLVLMLNNNDLVGKNLTIDLNSKKKEKDSGNVVLIGDFFNNIDINLNGYNGVAGDDASVICANRFNDGTYGVDAKTYFINRRSSNPLLTLSRCDNSDVNYLQTSKFSCDANYLEKFAPSVDLYRIKFKQRCVGTSIRYKCLQRQVKITCEWNSIARGYQYCDKDGCEGCGANFGATDCLYDGNACWYSDYQAAQYGAAYSATPSASVNPKWGIVKDLSRCTAQPRGFGGWFATQRSELIPESLYKNKLAVNKVEDICNLFPNPPQYPGNSGWKFNRVTEVGLTTPGLDPDTQLPLPGSNWTVKYSPFFTPCSSLGDYSELTSEINSWSAFGEIGGECKDVNLAEDENNLIPWSKAGQDQDASFGLEKITCSSTNCPVQNTVVNKELNFDYIDPTSGANGTKQGNGVLFVYDYKTITSSARPGSAGAGGNNDLTTVTTDKYCISVDDATNHSIDSSFAKTPVVNFNLYKWNALKINRGDPSGTNPIFSSNKVNIYRKIDSSVRYLLQKELL